LAKKLIECLPDFLVIKVFLQKEKWVSCVHEVQGVLWSEAAMVAKKVDCCGDDVFHKLWYVYVGKVGTCEFFTKTVCRNATISFWLSFLIKESK